MKIHEINPQLSLLELDLPAKGYGHFIGAYFYHGDKKALIDVGPTSAIPSLMQALRELKVKSTEIEYIILTHIHIDHAGGTGTVLKAMPNARVIVHPRGVRHLIDPSRLWEATLKTLPEMVPVYQAIEPVPAGKIDEAHDGMKIDLGKGIVLEVYLTPGHAPHHFSLFDRANSVLIAGEVAGVCFDGKARPATPPPFKLEEMLESIDKVAALKPEKICYSHFGCYGDGVERLRVYRERLINWSQIATAAVKEGKGIEEILELIGKNDPELAGMKNMDPDEYRREYLLLNNAIRGLGGIQLP